jgi:cysteine desulfurase
LQDRIEATAAMEGSWLSERMDSLDQTAMLEKSIYLDFNATTPIAPEVAAAISQVLAEPFGNPSSEHWAGLPARQAVEKARTQVAALLHCNSDEIVFTSGGSESNNHALKGVFFAQGGRGGHIVTTQVEHPAVLNPCRFLERLGASVTYLSVDRFGRVDPEDVRRAITPRSILISVMHANNEVGTLQPISEIARIAQERGILFHTDAAQSAGKIPVRVDELGVDLLSLAGHKLYASKGVGALYVRRGVRLEPLIHGAGHESGRRAGTENILLDVALGAACELAQSWLGVESIRQLRDLFWELLQARFGERVILNGHPTDRLPNTLNVSLVGKIGSTILSGLQGVAASTGSACHSGSVELSPVLKAMQVLPEIGMGAIRFSLGRTTTREEIEQVVSRL